MNYNSYNNNRSTPISHNGITGSRPSKKTMAIIQGEGCEHCVDPDGLACLPEYGLAPHKSFSKDGKVIPSEFTNEEDPDFEPDPDDPKVGVWYCPNKDCPNSKVKQNEKR